MRDRLQVALEIASAGCLTVGASLASPVAGWLTAGSLGMLFAWRGSR